MFRKSLSTNILLLKIVGAWPYNDFNKLASFAYLSFTICFFLVPVSCFPLLYIYLNETKDLIQISQTAFMSCELTLIMPKLVALLLDHRKLRTAVSYWDEQNVYLMMPPGTEEIIIKTARYAKITCKWFTWLCVMGATTWATKPFQDLSKRKLPTDLWLPFDPFKNDFRYALTYLHSYAGKYYLIASFKIKLVLFPNCVARVCIFNMRVSYLNEKIDNINMQMFYKLFQVVSYVQYRTLQWTQC